MSDVIGFSGLNDVLEDMCDLAQRMRRSNEAAAWMQDLADSAFDAARAIERLRAANAALTAQLAGAHAAIAELEGRIADEAVETALGRMVAGMPLGWRIGHNTFDPAQPWTVSVLRGDTRTEYDGATPEEAWRKAEEAQPAGYRAACGVLPAADGAPSSEDVVREGRDAE